MTLKASWAPHAEVVYGVTRLSPEQPGPQRWLGVVRQHGQSENQVHWVRDVTFDEARSHVRGGSLPQVMAAFRRTAIGLMPWAGETTIAAACRRFAAQPWSAVALMGITPDNSMALPPSLLSIFFRTAIAAVTRTSSLNQRRT